MEAICAGVPLFYNEKFAVQVAEIGVSVGAEIAVHLGQEDKVGECVRVNREKVIWEDQEKEKRRES
ncbi:hypothetical protein JHK86_012198 [Glycine max]|nr:hypothetical protein JHK86_012198 [Glycine max]